MEGQHGENEYDASVSCSSFTFKGEANVFKVEKFLNNILKTKAQDMLRCKGLLAAKGMDTKFSFQGRVHFESGDWDWVGLFSDFVNTRVMSKGSRVRLPAGVHNMLSAGFHSEWKADEERMCQFVFIGRSAENDQIWKPAPS